MFFSDSASSMPTMHDATSETSIDAITSGVNAGGVSTMTYS